MFLCVNSYSQNTMSLPKNTPAYLVLNREAINIDTLMVRECSAKEIASLIKQMNKVCDENKRIFPWNDVVASIISENISKSTFSGRPLLKLQLDLSSLGL